MGEKGLTSVERRALEHSLGADTQSLLHQHTVLCQTYLPYRDPGPEVRLWTRSNGVVRLALQAGMVIDPDADRAIEVGLPFGPKVRLLLANLNTRALQQGSRIIKIEEERFTQFVRAMQNPSHPKEAEPNGREIRAFKEQLTRLATASVMLATRVSDKRMQIERPQILTGFQLTLQDRASRLLWPDQITLSQEYFSSLQHHAVPLNEHALAALSHSAMALDIYCWLAQRLGRIDRDDHVPLSWQVLQTQFGQGYGLLKDFRRAFQKALGQVLQQYPKARVEQIDGGLILRRSEPPVPPRALR